MAADEFLCGGQTEPGAIRPARHQRIENRVLQLGRDARSVVFDLYARYDPVPDVADRETHDGASTQRDLAMSVQCGTRVLQEVEKRLDHLIPVKIKKRQAGIVITPDLDSFLPRLDEAHDVLEQFVYVDCLLVRRSARSQQGVDKTGKAVRFADDDIRVFPEILERRVTSFISIRRRALSAGSDSRETRQSILRSSG